MKMRDGKHGRGWDKRALASFQPYGAVPTKRVLKSRADFYTVTSK